MQKHLGVRGIILTRSSPGIHVTELLNSSTCKMKTLMRSIFSSDIEQNVGAHYYIVLNKKNGDVSMILKST